jgi:hypothetical protein
VNFDHALKISGKSDLAGLIGKQPGSSKTALRPLHQLFKLGKAALAFGRLLPGGNGCEIMERIY